MGALAFVFSGQGDQRPGMGRGLCENHATAARVFDACEAIRPGTKELCFTGPADELGKTANAQPCLFALEMATDAVLRERGMAPAAVAGFSLGEVAAATSAGLFDLETGFRLVCRRGELMQEAVGRADTAMAAVLGLPADQLEGLCLRFGDVHPANYNCPGQIAVSGLASQMAEFSAAARAAGAKVVPLKVAGAFHSPFMHGAAQAFAETLSVIRPGKSATPVYSNVTARPYGDARTLLAQQVESPVRWEETVRNMIAAGIDRFIEVGPGRTLCNMIRRIDATVEARPASELV